MHLDDPSPASRNVSDPPYNIHDEKQPIQKSLLNPIVPSIPKPRSSRICTISTPHRLRSRDGARREAETALLPRGLVDARRHPDIPGAVAVGVGAGQQTGAVEGQVVVGVDGPALGLEPAARGAIGVFVEVLEDALA